MAWQVSDEKKSPFYTKGKCFGDCEVTLAVGEEKTESYVCMDQLAKLSDYFRAMFYGDFQEKNEKKFQISDERADDVVHFFDVLIGTDRETSKITDDSIELFIRLADKFQCDILKEWLNDYIKENVSKCQNASTILNWLIWSVKYHMPHEAIKACLPGVACLQVSSLNENREIIGWELYSKLMEAKYDVLAHRCVSMCCNRCGSNMANKPFCTPLFIHCCSGVNTAAFTVTGGSIHQCGKCGKNECLCDRKQYETLFNQ